VFEMSPTGLRVRGVAAAELRTNVARVLDMVRWALTPGPSVSSNCPAASSSEWAVARAIAFSPTVVLFDEPLSNLDAKCARNARRTTRTATAHVDITALT